ncbi:HTH-type transcriptional regulator CysL [Aquimixticola soesokkakensis]|uniref:HTH-type transcriptional regulator CysL n=1 Tax=Aquimixticola soesokkakensis TaxID=1519096 RepID=A0A1Y5TGP4_9RHOB|nr:LysR substrate-binding domain-containing protein [Aquimixticola soesokkakensis]SLN63239.1 HTH-type transcriptional regulator CysL [Aquimixticola soesokkakensis]
MSVDFRKLQSFVKIIDAGSISRAAGLLNTVQPALSQQIAALEQHFGQKLLIRSNSGVTPTEAGLVLYRHAQLMLKYLEQASLDISRASQALAGHVSIGLATYSSSSTLSLPIIQEVRRIHSGITVHINDSFGQILSELVMSGRMDMAIIYASQPIKGTKLTPLFSEELFLVANAETDMGGSQDASLDLKTLENLPLVLPGRGHFLRKLIDEAFARVRIDPVVVAEIDSVPSLAAAVKSGIGASILPLSVVRGTPGLENAHVRKLVKPAIRADVSLCTPDPAPMSEPALAVKAVLLKVVAELIEKPQAGLMLV